MRELLPLLERVRASGKNAKDQVEQYGEDLLALLDEKNVPPWYAAPVFAHALILMFEHNLEVSDKLRAEGRTNPSEDPCD